MAKSQISIRNRRAFYDYHVMEKLECGIVLEGPEVKSIRHGKATLTESYARISDDHHVFLHGMHISPYAQDTTLRPDPTRMRRLLLHRREIKQLEKKLLAGGTTLIPLSVYFKGGRCKVELGLCRGKQKHDKRQGIRDREYLREIARGMGR